jgi:hypothetical protein
VQRRTQLFDHLVGAREQRRRNVKANRLGDLEINDQFIVGGRLYREISRLLTFEN